MKIGATIREPVSSYNQRVASIYGRTTVNRRMQAWRSIARKELYELYAPAMMSVCARYVHDRETARDLLQDGFIKVFTKIQTYSATGPFGAWLRRVFVTTALEYLRKYDALRSSAPIDEYGEQVEDVDASVLDRLSADDLLECISRLPTGYRTVFNLYAIEGYTHKEIAAMLHIQEITSRSQFARARKALQEMVQSLIAQDNVSRNRT